MEKIKNVDFTLGFYHLDTVFLKSKENDKKKQKS